VLPALIAGIVPPNMLGRATSLGSVGSPSPRSPAR
jgi:hypothetical protein